MELLNHPRADYLLSRPLESLHTDCVEWLADLNFWADEISFFYKFIHLKELPEAFPSNEVAEIDRELVKLHGDKIDQIRGRITVHERELASMIKSSSVHDEHIFRNNHRELVDEIYQLQADIRSFKQKIFSLGRNVL